MLKTQSATINGKSYQCTQLASRNGGNTVYRKLHKFVLPIIGALKDAQDKRGSFERAAELVGDLVANDECWAQIQQLLSTVTCNGKLVAEDHDHWDDHRADLYEVIWLALKTNYESIFTSAVGSAFDLEKLAGGLKSPKPS